MTAVSLASTIRCIDLIHPRTIEKAVPLCRSRRRQHLQVVDQASDNEASHLRLEPECNATGGNTAICERGRDISTSQGSAAGDKTR